MAEFHLNSSNMQCICLSSSSTGKFGYRARSWWTNESLCTEFSFDLMKILNFRQNE